MLDWCFKLQIFDISKISVFVLDEADVMIGTQGYSDQSVRIKSKFWTIEHTRILRDLQTDLLAAQHLHTRNNKTHLVIRVIAGAIGFTYVTFYEGETVPIAYKSHLYSTAEQRFATTEKTLTAVQMAVIKERPLAQGKRIIVVSPIPALEDVTKASVPNAKTLLLRWIQWATSLTATDVDYIFDPKLQTQEFLQYEIEYPVSANILPIEQYQRVMYTDGSAQPAIGTKHQYSAACAVSFNEYLHYWRQNGFRDSKDNTIQHRLLWGKVADLKETLPNVHVVHTLGHQRVGIHVAGNTLADEAAKSAVAVVAVAAVTRLSSKPDADIWAAVTATADGTPYPKGFPNKYHYRMGGMLIAEVKIPGIAVRDIPNKDIRSKLIKAAHEGEVSAHAGVAATVLILQAHYWRPGLYKETKQFQWVSPQRSADARTVIKDLRVFIGTYAVAAFHSDQGLGFASRAFRDAMASLGVQLQYSSPFHPEGNSVVKRFNRD
ncbi:hypothetical protein NDU88_000113 [Pleurodeles waltl]|uniref:Gypsy retrotransposon integrase-like protein 1 n=1 Tax=Pleurodeles waltl TaxID=8319 RepID=A0AAV7TE68_PLEWA|nr:hypothetical protein NDU88_000113 [Pleurodeles waltl]